MNRKASVIASILVALATFSLISSPSEAATLNQLPSQIQAGFAPYPTISGYKCLVILPNGNVVQTAKPVKQIEPANLTTTFQLMKDFSFTLQGNTVSNTTQPIQNVGDTYFLTGNITQYTLLIDRNNVIIDGKNLTDKEKPASDYCIDGGIELYGLTNVTVENIQVNNTSGEIGIGLFNSTNCTVANNSLVNNAGMYIEGSSNNVIADNVIYDCQGFGGSYWGGINISTSNNNTFTSNKLYNCVFGLYLNADLSDYMNSIDSSNLVNGYPVYYLVNKTNLLLSPNKYSKIGFLALINCDNITVENLKLTNYTFSPSEESNPFAMLLICVNNSRIVSNKIVASVEGVEMVNCSYNLLKDNTITVPLPNSQGFDPYPLSITGSNNTITENVFVGGGGLNVQSANNDVYGNTYLLPTPSPASPFESSKIQIYLVATVVSAGLAIAVVAVIVRHRKTANLKQ